MLGDDWPNPPMWENLLLENPWPLGGVALAAGVALFVVGGRQGRGSLQLASLGCVALAGGIFALTHFVVTDRERLQQKSRDIVDAFAEPFDAELLQSRVTDDVTLFDWRVGHLVDVAERASGTARVTRYHVRPVRVEQDGPHHARTGISVIGRMRHRAGESAFNIQAIFHWRRTPEGQWRLYRVRRLWYNQGDAEQLVRQFVRF